MWMLNRILQPCESVIVCGREFLINTEFSVWIEIEDRLFSDRGKSQSVLAEILTLAYPLLPPEPEEAFRKILWFYAGGETHSNAKDFRETAISAPVCNLKKDFGYVWAAFLNEFGVDLTIQRMHWWRFRCLLESLSENCKFSKIVSYRAVDVMAVKDQDLRTFYERMKHRYRLPDTRSVEEREAETALKLEHLF